MVERERPPVHFLAVESVDSRLSLMSVVHLDEAEAFRAASVPVHDNLRRLHGAMLAKHLLQALVGHAVGQIAYIQLLAHGASKK